ncbi:MAG: thioredoxin [Candidatus Cloacimonetes bacterium]|nr:thioredoxin [Candidatus Cloacimonadota bacterium]MBL7148948.1 thioredoxin [Candidatus Cloacimonadota bacterium]
MVIIDVNLDNFEEEVLKSDIPVLVDLWAPWCGPCKAIGSTVSEIAEEYTGKLKVVKLNIDQSPSLATEYKIMSIPTLLIFKDGQVDGQIIGLVGKDKIESKFKHLI